MEFEFPRKLALQTILGSSGTAKTSEEASSLRMNVTLSLGKDGRPTRAFVNMAVGLGIVSIAPLGVLPVNSGKSPGDSS